MIDIEKLADLLPVGLAFSDVTTEPDMNAGRTTLISGVSHGIMMTYEEEMDEAFVNHDQRHRYAIAFIDWLAHNHPQTLEEFYQMRKALDGPEPMKFSSN